MRSLLAPLALIPIVSAVPGGSLAAQDRSPSLVVVVVVDQMRQDFLTRYAGFYRSGMAALLRDGVVFTDAHHEHAVTETAVGHAALVTGVVPARHGIVGNVWYDRPAGRTFYASEDSTSPLAGFPDAGGRSPRQLRAGTVGDWLKAASPASRVVAVALKDRAAALMGGREADGAFWYLETVGRFVTSAYYGGDSLPWLAAFNGSGRVESYFAEGWDRALPPEAYFVSREDSFPTEADGARVTFPHGFTGDSVPGAEYYREFRISPYADEVTFALARELVGAYGLGTDSAPDLLLIGASAADYMGHSFGPLSQEAQDYYFRLDAMLGELMAFLDEGVGSDRYYLILTSDHGVLPLPEELARRGFPARRVGQGEFQGDLQGALLPALDSAGLVEFPRVRFANGIVFEFPPGAVTDAQRAVLRRVFAAEMRKVSYVEDTYTLEELRGEGTSADRPYRDLYRRQFPPDLMPDVAFRFAPYTLVLSGEYGTTHGSPYVYDTHIPLIVAGPGLAAAQHGRRVRSVDVAPTVARLLGIPVPDGLDGAALPEIVGR